MRFNNKFWDNFQFFVMGNEGKDQIDEGARIGFWSAIFFLQNLPQLFYLSPGMSSNLANKSVARFLWL